MIEEIRLKTEMKEKLSQGIAINDHFYVSAMNAFWSAYKENGGDRDQNVLNVWARLETKNDESSKFSSFVNLVWIEGNTMSFRIGDDRTGWNYFVYKFSNNNWTLESQQFDTKGSWNE